MAIHTMTPARRAALRKAQLASAAKRRRHGTVGGAIRRATRQRAGYVGASANVAFRHNAKSRDFSGKAKKGLKYAAIGLGAAAAVGTYAHATRNERAYVHNRKATMARQMSRKLPSTHPVSRRLAKSAMSHQRSAARLQGNRLKPMKFPRPNPYGPNS
jgi:hypothetical protein